MEPNIKKLIVFISALALLLFAPGKSSGKIHPGISEADEQRARELVMQMTLEEKCLLLGGQVDNFHSAEISRLGIPAVRMADGPLGVRNKTKSTLYPCPIALAASWNRDIAFSVGTGIGTDAKERGVGIMLCPGVNIYRSPLCGRNFEYMGEDPYLASETASAFIKGVQDNGTMATVKHFVANNQEYQRHQVGSSIGERVLNEIYFPAFRKAVEQAHVGAVMTSYNPLNGIHTSEDAWLIRDNLRKWGFKGLVMSDWGSCYSTVGLIQGGMNMEMGRAKWLTCEYIRPLIENGAIHEREIDEMCTYILQTFSAFGLLDRKLPENNDIPVNEESRKKAYAAALESPVLLKNDGILPLKGGNIVIMGPNADHITMAGGMHAIDGTVTTLCKGMKDLGKKYRITHINGPSDEKTVREADAVIYVGGFNKLTEREDADRSFNLEKEQNTDINKVAELNSNLIVVIYSGGEIGTESWLNKTRAFILGWYGGQEGGKALAQIISGAVSPSGHLPFTFWGGQKKNPSDRYYGLRRKVDPKSNRDFVSYTSYDEGIFVGYRGVEHFGVEPRFPFGFGLSYSSFEYSGLSVKKSGNGFDISFTVRNTGDMEASEVAQVYISPVNPGIIRPAKELKGYEKIKLAKGNASAVNIHLDNEAFSYYDVLSHSWQIEAGAYKIFIGSSSQDSRLEAELTL